MSKQTLVQLAADRLSAGPDQGSRAASKYDFVKVKVWLGDDMAHYYVLSRFLISRMLTVTKVPHQKAIKIALEVKKHLVDNDRLDITQAELEAILFGVMRGKGFGEEFINRYRMVNQFFQQKRPLIILICGSACTGKSTFAQQLASRLNLPNVLQTDILYELLRTGGMGALSSTPLWSREGLADDDLVSEFQKECRIIRQGLEGDLCKAIKDGKPIIIEGLHLDPGLYLDEFGRHGMIGMGGTASLELPPDLTLAAAAAAALGLGEQQQAAGSVSESLAGAPPSPAGPLSSRGSEDGAAHGLGSPPVALSGEPSSSSAFPPPVPGSPAGQDLGREDSSDGIVLARRSASFSDAATSGLAYTDPAYSKQSPWRHLRPGGFLHRLLHRPGSAKDPQTAAAQQAELRQLRRPASLPPPAPAPAPVASHAQHPLPSPQQPAPRGVVRTASLGQVTFMLQQEGEDAPLAPVPVIPGAEVVVPTSPLSPLREAGSSLPLPLPLPPPAGAVISAAEGQALPPEQLGQGGSSGGHAPSTQESHDEGEGPLPGSPTTAAASNGFASLAMRSSAHPPPAAAPPIPLAAEGPLGAAAAASLGPAPPAGEGGPRASPRDSQGPVFVPLVLSMNPRDYELVVQEWQAARGSFWEAAGSGGREGAGGGGGGGQPGPGPGSSGGAQHEGDGGAAVLHRLRVLQEYLSAYGAVGVPVVGVRVGSFSETLDRLHDYLLQCIAISL